jgi:hypothetical protein
MEQPITETSAKAPKPVRKAPAAKTSAPLVQSENITVASPSAVIGDIQSKVDTMMAEKIVNSVEPVAQLGSRLEMNDVQNILTDHVQRSQAPPSEKRHTIPESAPPGRRSAKSAAAPEASASASADHTICVRYIQMYADRLPQHPWPRVEEVARWNAEQAAAWYGRMHSWVNTSSAANDSNKAFGLFTVSIANLIETAANGLAAKGQIDFTLSNFTKSVEAAVLAGDFQSEFDQLYCEWGGMFEQRAELRLLVKLATLGQKAKTPRVVTFAAAPRPSKYADDE